MPGKESMTPKQNRILVEEGYEPRDVVNISFETERKKVTLDEGFLMLHAQERKDKIVKCATAIITLVCGVTILLASIYLLRQPEKPTKVMVVTTQAVTETPEPTVAPTATPKKTPKPTRKPKKTRKPKPTKSVTQAPVVVTPKPVITKAPVVVTKAPVVTKQPKKEEDPFVVDDDKGDYEVE